MEPVQSQRPPTKTSISQKEVAKLASIATQADVLTQALDGCRIGDKNAEHALERQFAPLIAMLATKRAGGDVPACTKLIERGRSGLHQAVQRFPTNEPVRQFRIFALDYIEKAMDNPKRGLLRFFGLK